MSPLSLYPLLGLPQVASGDDLAGLLAETLSDTGGGAQSGDVLVVCQKIVSKAEGRIVSLADVQPSARAEDFADSFDKDARVVELALREAREILRMEDGHLITTTGPGWVAANSGVDCSNQNEDGEATLLPLDADQSAAALRAALTTKLDVEMAVVISDTFGRAWRLGQMDLAIGAAGFEVLDDRSGGRDWSGRPLSHTELAVADQLAAAAGLLMTKNAGVPAVLVRGFAYRRGQAQARDLIRATDDDLFR
ncbi:MAG: coenzyme F420-0:L-glutamate ligase [Deltaproteobacteria bacterium]